MPEVVVESVVGKATTVLESLGMRPSGALRTRTVKDVVDAVIGNLGIRVDQVLQECRDEGGSLEDLAVSGVHRRCMDKVCRVLETLPTAATPWSAPVPVPAAVVAPASSSPSSSSSSSSHPPPTPAMSRVVPPAPAARPASVTVCTSCAFALCCVGFSFRVGQEWLGSVGLGEYSAALEGLGFTNLEAIARMNEALVREMAGFANMQPGHTLLLIVSQASLRARLSLP